MEESIPKRKGLGSAKITIREDCVTKQGEGMAKQALHCVRLYPITPEIYTSTTGDVEVYSMEVLTEPDVSSPTWPQETLFKMRELLADTWSVDAYYPTRDSWQRHLVQFCGEHGFGIWSLLYDLRFDSVVMGGLDSIHGDPTLANVMMRGDVIVITDPIRPTGKIPPHWTVDLGKMLQSAIGWETALYGLKIDIDPCIAAVLDGLEDITKMRAWFWCMVHCLRIVPHASEYPLIQEWARNNALKIYSSLMVRKIPCFTPSI